MDASIGAMEQFTRQEAERKRQQAVAFMERLGQETEADRFAEMDVAEYAESRGAELVENPNHRRCTMATKAELENLLDEVETKLNEAYQPEASRETLAEAVGEALNLVQAEEEDDQDVDDDDEDED